MTGVFAYQDTCEGGVVIDVAFTDRRLDLGDAAPTEVRRAAVDELASATGATVHLVHQVHAADVLDVGDVDPRTTYDADAMVTARAGQALLVRAADCVPVLLADPASGVVGAAHCGRPGLAAGVVPATLAAMRDLGAEQVRAWIGPHVCGSCYEVPAAMQEEVSALVPEARATTSWGTPSLDLGAGVRAQLETAGVPHLSVDRCTREDDDLWSYRRDGKAAGRQGGLVWIRP